MIWERRVLVMIKERRVLMMKQKKRVLAEEVIARPGHSRVEQLQLQLQLQLQSQLCHCYLLTRSGGGPAPLSTALLHTPHCSPLTAHHVLLCNSLDSRPTTHSLWGNIPPSLPPYLSTNSLRLSLIFCLELIGIPWQQDRHPGWS